MTERGESGVSLSTLVDICNVLKVDTSIIFTGLITANNTTEAEQLIKSLYMFEKEDLTIVSNLIKYIIDSKR